MKHTIFDREVPKDRFESWMQRRQTEVMITGLVFFAWIVIRFIFGL